MLKLKRVELQGFKSFCDRTELRFNGEGRCIMIPWEDQESGKQKGPAVAAYPAQELGGYVWAYLGDAKDVPPPPLEQEVPEELVKPDEFIWFRLPMNFFTCFVTVAPSGPTAST